jgi:uncharacterized membrane protein YjgN (DUF898 family)
VIRSLPAHSTAPMPAGAATGAVTAVVLAATVAAGAGVVAAAVTARAAMRFTAVSLRSGGRSFRGHDPNLGPAGSPR